MCIAKGSGPENGKPVSLSCTHIANDLAVLKWVVGCNLAMTVAVLWKVFS